MSGINETVIHDVEKEPKKLTQSVLSLNFDKNYGKSLVNFHTLLLIILNGDRIFTRII